MSIINSITPILEIETTNKDVSKSPTHSHDTTSTIWNTLYEFFVPLGFTHLPDISNQLYIDLSFHVQVQLLPILLIINYLRILTLCLFKTKRNTNLSWLLPLSVNQQHIVLHSKFLMA